MVSLLLHGLLLYLFATQLPAERWGPGSTSDGLEGGSREVGIYVKGGGDGGTPGSDQAPAQRPQDAILPEPPDASLDAANARSDDNVVSDKPPADLMTPLAANPALGPGPGVGPPPPSAFAEAARLRGGAQGSGGTGTIGFGSGSGDGSRGGSGAGTGHGLGSGPGVGPFFGIGDRGTRFVYVIDCSGSMTNYSAIRVAKQELLSSLETLERTQQFQVIFYNLAPRVMTLPGHNRDDLYWATDVNRSLARQFIANVQADLGTDHLTALKLALRMKPEVIFFLTDADEPQLTAGDLDELRRLNGNQSRIHCIEFGKGPELATPNFLKKLAGQNGGRYSYRDVTSFGRQPGADR